MSSTQRPPSPRKLPLRTRKRSPSPSPTHSHFHHSKGYSPSSRAADISRLLDPSYSSSSSSSSSPTAVYVDHHGDLHDPDYRDFPAVTPRRPTWERKQTDDGDEDEDTTPYPTSRYSRHMPQPHTRRASAPPSGHAYPYRPTSTYYQYEMAVHDDEELDSSLESTTTVLADAEEKPRKGRRGMRRSAKTAPEPGEEAQAMVGEKRTESSHGHEQDAQETRTEQEWTPTCTQSIQREWQAFALRLRFGVFRAKRKVKRRVGL